MHPETLVAAVPPDAFDLGHWLGMRRAFGIMAGKASVADVECLRRIRNERLYVVRSHSWAEFCDRQLGASKTNINRLIFYLEKFGPEFFALTNLTHIPAEAYRIVAPHVKEEGLEFDGEVIALSTPNVPRLTEAVAELRCRAGSRPPRRSQREDPYRAIERLVDDLIRRVDALPARLAAENEIALGIQMRRLRDRLERVGVSI